MSSALALETVRQPSPRARVALWLGAVLVAAAALAWLFTHEPQRIWPADPVLQVSFDGEHYRIDPGELAGLACFSTLHFAEGEEAARALVASDLSSPRCRHRLPAAAVDVWEHESTAWNTRSR